ncbi:protein NinF [Buttiauxella gaviniae]|uniref:protein NinF n=1 Tax=Buttiauxella gaviniae TaxID=82990 RepID=UPI003C78A5F4
MLSPTETARYERNSNAAAGYCAACTKPLSGETYFCDECAHEAYVETDPNSRMNDDN